MTVAQVGRLRDLFGTHGRVTRTDIHRSLGRNHPVSEIETVLADLLESGVLRRLRERAPAGRSVDFYELVEDMTGWLEDAINAGKISTRPYPQRPPEDTIYFIASGGGPIKIGLTRRVEVRLGVLQVASPVPLRLLGSLKGGRKVERAIHLRFAASRLHGEWFEPSTELLEFIAACAYSATEDEPNESNENSEEREGQ